MDGRDENSISSHENVKSVPEIYRIREKCPLCLSFNSHFYCESCITKGDFTSTTDANSETFAVKKASLLERRERHIAAANMCRSFVNKKLSSAKLPEEINECQERINILKALIKGKKESIEKQQEELLKSQEKNKSRASKMLQYRERVDKLECIVKGARTKNIEKKKKLELLKLALKSVVQKHIKQLVKYVFPIERVSPVSKSTDSVESDVTSALAEASKTSLVRGAWVVMDSSTEMQYRIVAPSLPASGDYSAYLAVENENGVPLTDQIGENEAYNIAAALCYTTQLTHLLSFYLDVILPKKISYADFCTKDLTERQFRRKVANLNSNVLYLCFSQGIDSMQLNPLHTLNNLLNLVRHDDLGQTGPFLIDAGLTLGLECTEAEWRDGDGSDQEDGVDHFPWEWEAIPLVACTEAMSGAGMSSTQASSSIAGGLVTSLASYFRGWTGK